MLNNSNSTKNFNLIQVFRGLAAILVLLAHGNDIFNRELHQNFLFNIFYFGGAGVDFFFVLSGFIIFYIHRYDIGHPNKFKLFILKRFIRVYPLYWLILTGKIAASLLFSYGGDIHQRNLSEIVRAILLYPQDRNILLNSFVGVSWTLSHEIFFYLMFSLLIIVIPKFSLPVVIAWLIGTFLNFTGIIEVFKEDFLLQFIFNARNLEFALGCLAAYLVSKHRIKYGMLFASVAIFFFTISAINSNYNLIEISPVISYGVPSMLLIIGAVSLELSRKIRIPYVFIHIGNSSYSIYLMHGFLVSNIVKLIDKFSLDVVMQNTTLLNIITIIIVIITISIGCAIYSYIEKPLITTLRLKLIGSNPKVSHTIT
jgi:peptidoglycan/LPS O-acetylase OafA/YrhL